MVLDWTGPDQTSADCLQDVVFVSFIEGKDLDLRQVNLNRIKIKLVEVIHHFGTEKK